MGGFPCLLGRQYGSRGEPGFVMKKRDFAEIFLRQSLVFFFFGTITVGQNRSGYTIF